MSGERGALFDALFRPRAVALIGASSDPSKNTGRPLRFLRQHGYRGAVYPVNPARARIAGERAYRCIGDVPGAVDHALIMVPAAKVAQAVRECGAARVKVATVYSDGFADLGSGEGVARQRELLRCARDVGVRLVGPNSMGVMSFVEGLTLSVNAILEMPRIPCGGLSVVSQSGSMLGSLLSRGSARGFGFARMVSVGNEADLGVGELMELLIDDASTKSLLLFMESLRGADAIGAAARRAHEAGKAVVAYKLGRSLLGRSLAATHSGAMTGAAEVAGAFFRAHGIVQVEMLETLLEIPPLLVHGAAARRPRLSVMTTTGGGAATVVDRLGAAGIETVPADARVVRSLAAHGLDVAGKPIVDLTMAGARRETVAQALQGLLDDARSDAVLVVVGSSARFHPELTVEPIATSRHERKPLAVFIVPDAPEALALLASRHVAAFRTPECCADALRALFAWSPPRLAAAAGEVPAEALALIRAGVGRGFNEVEAAKVFSSLGIPVPSMQRLVSPEDAVTVRFPVVLKLLSRTITHKSEAHGVVLALDDPSALDDAVRRMHDRLRRSGQESDCDGFLVQQMREGIAEAVVGYRRDPEVGPLVSVGAGGRLTELHRDFALRQAPVTRGEARAMVDEVVGLAPLRGYRASPKGDCEALADALVALSRLALVEDPPIAEAEINPLLVGREGEGVVAVDAVIVLAKSGSSVGE